MRLHLLPARLLVNIRIRALLPHLLTPVHRLRPSTGLRLHRLVAVRVVCWLFLPLQPQSYLLVLSVPARTGGLC